MSLLPFAPLQSMLLTIHLKKLSAVHKSPIKFLTHTIIETSIKQINSISSSKINNWVTDVQTLRREEDAISVLHDLDKRGIPVDSHIYSSLLHASTNARSLTQGKILHAHILLTGFELSKYVGTKLLRMYANCGDSFEDACQVFDEMRKPNFSSSEDARNVFDKIPKRNLSSSDGARLAFDKMPEPDVLPWNIMIRCCAIYGFCDGALTLYCKMQREGVRLDKFTFPPVLKACGSLGFLQQGKGMHVCIVKYGYELDAFVGSALLDMYATCGDVQNSCRVFDKMCQRDVVSWTSMIRGYVQNGQAKVAMELFRRMQLTDVKPNLITISSILPVCAHLVDLQKGKEIHDYALKRGFVSDVFVASSLVDMYAKCGAIELARCVFDNMSRRNVVSWNSIIAGYAYYGKCDGASRLFHQMQTTGTEPNLVTWNTMIAGYSKNGLANEAIELLYQMQLDGVKPDSVTIASVLPACAPLAALQQGKEIHGQVIRKGFDLNVFVGSALIDMYCKCGSVDIARRVFDNMLERDAVLWNAMIVGYGMYGHAEEAMALFERMQQLGVKPDQVTLIGVLCACCHSGLVDRGIEFFNQMIYDYHIVPRMEHYASMVDLLGRAGYLAKAEDFIKNMPIEPGFEVWGALLNACRVHHDIDVGERVAERLFELEPENAGYYILLSNIYADAGRWDDVAKVRAKMKSRGLKKIPGRSWIEVND